MRKILFALLIILAVPLIGRGGDKPELKWRKFEAGLAEAKKSGKKILLDVYTDWCVWCKKLDKEVYGNEKIAEYLNNQYVLIKLNAESKVKVKYKGEKLTEMELAQGFGVKGYPTIIFLEPNADAINKLGGYVGPDEFLPIAKFIGEDHFKKMSWEDYKIKNGIRDKIVN